MADFMREVKLFEGGGDEPNPRRWWARLATKANPVTRAIIYYLGNVRPVWTPHDYEKLCKEGFNTQATVYSAVTLIAGAAAASWILYEKPRGKGRAQVMDHPLLTLLGHPI
jgi:phage portal protein BeeE